MTPEAQRVNRWSWAVMNAVHFSRDMMPYLLVRHHIANEDVATILFSLSEMQDDLNAMDPERPDPATVASISTRCAFLSELWTIHGPHLKAEQSVRFNEIWSDLDDAALKL